MGDEPVSVSPLLILNGWIGHCVLLHEGDLQAKRTACWTLCSLNFDSRHCLYTLWFRARCAPRYLSITKGRALAVLHSRCSSCAGRNSRWSGGCLRKQCIESTNRQHCCPCLQRRHCRPRHRPGSGLCRSPSPLYPVFGRVLGSE